MRRMLFTGLLAAGLIMLVTVGCQAQAENQAPAVTAAPAPAAGAKEVQRGKGQARMARLTEEQRQQVQAKVKELKAANAKPEEIKAAVATLLKGFGVTVDAGKNKGAGKGAGKGEGHGFMGQLTPDQRTQLLAKMTAMKAANATPEETRAAVVAMLKDWGVEAPQGQRAGQGQGREWMAKLTAEQRDQVQAKLKELRAAGKTREEIKTAVAEMLKGWGVEVGAGRGQGQGGPLKPIMEKLTPDQRQQAQAKVKELRDAGKNRQEIKAVVLEMLKGWGVEAPQ